MCILEFSNTNVYKGDILIINAIGHKKLVGIYMVADDTWEEYLDGSDDKWPYKYTLKCLTKEFSQKWWLYDIKTMAFVDFVNARIKEKLK